jgi:chemotaxis protein MotB
MGESKTVVIKKVKKVMHGGHHGGSWKVAYADFVTAMMAFFLLLWLVTMASPEKRARVSQYFKEFSLFEKGGTSVMDYTAPANIQIANPEGQRGASSPNDAENSQTTAIFQEKFIESLQHEIESKLADVKDQILIQTFEKGVRVEVVDRYGSAMFPLSSTDLTPAGSKILGVIARTLMDGDHPIAIEGHTDARVFSSTKYSNWELSTARASAARLELEKGGLPPSRLIRVSGFASTEPLIRDDPLDPRNRRISILVFK